MRAVASRLFLGHGGACPLHRDSAELLNPVRRTDSSPGEPDQPPNASGATTLLGGAIAASDSSLLLPCRSQGDPDSARSLDRSERSPSLECYPRSLDPTVLSNWPQ